MPTNFGEPWFVVPGKKSDELFIVQTGPDGRPGQRVARLWNVMRAGGVPDNEARDAHAARLVECVNLFAASPHPAKTIELMREVLTMAMASGNEPLVRRARGVWKRLGWDQSTEER